MRTTVLWTFSRGGTSARARSRVCRSLRVPRGLRGLGLLVRALLEQALPNDGVSRRDGLVEVELFRGFDAVLEALVEEQHVALSEIRAALVRDLNEEEDVREDRRQVNFADSEVGQPEAGDIRQELGQSVEAALSARDESFPC